MILPSSYLTPNWTAAPPNVRALTTYRSGGVSQAPYDDGSGDQNGGGLNLAQHVGDRLADVEENRRRLNSLLPTAPVWLEQTHGIHLVEADKVKNKVKNKIENLPQADASFTTKAGVVCAVLTADCLPILLCGSSGQVVAAVHAGWRGLAAGIVQNTVAAMRQAGARNVMAWLGPAIGPNQFEVGEDVRAAFLNSPQTGAVAGAAFVPIPNRPGKYWANLYLLAQQILQIIDVTNISGGNFCTVQDADLFYSYRRDRITGRMASLIWLAAPLT